MKVKLVAAGAVFGLLTQWPVGVASGATKYWNGAGTWTAANTWSLTSGGPYNQSWASGDHAVFDVPNSTITGANVTFSAITANEGVTLTAGGTLSTGGGVATITVNKGWPPLRFGTQAIATTAGTGFIKNGIGVWALAGSAYPGNFTINAGAVAMEGANALGGTSATRTLTLNGGQIRSNSSVARDLGTRFGGGIIIGGDITLGAAAPADGAMSFGNNVTLGAATRKITTDGTVTLSGIISGSAGAGLTKAGAGILTLSGANTYTGATTVAAGTLRLTRTDALAAGTDVTLATDATIDLDYDGTLTVRSLYVGDTLQYKGVYGASRLPGRITGRGYLRTTEGPIQGTVILVF